MKMQRSFLTSGLVIALFLTGGVIIWAATQPDKSGSLSTEGNTRSALDNANKPLVTVQPPNTCHYCSTNLVGKSAKEVAQFVQNYARQSLQAKGSIEVLLTRIVTNQDLATLSLGCGTNFTAIETPPLILTIMKGAFDLRRVGPGFGGHPPIPGKPGYIVYVFDAWAGSPTVTITSEDGALVKKALQDSTLPDNPDQMPTVCATPVPSAQKQLHYGDAAPGFDPPTPAPPEPTTETTPGVPGPVPTAYDPIPTAVPAP